MTEPDVRAPSHDELMGDLGKRLLAEDGEYQLMIQKTEPGFTTTGKPKVKIQMKILECPEYEDVLIFHNLTLPTDDEWAAMLTGKRCQSWPFAAGFFSDVNYSWMGDFPSTRELAEDLLGIEFTGNVYTESSEEFGESNRVRFKKSV